MNILKLYTGQHPLKNDDFDFLQTATRQGLNASVAAFAKKGNGFVVLEGCKPVINQALSTSSVDVYDVSEGYMVYDYEIIFCPAQQVTVPSNAPLQYRIDEQPVPTGTRQYANGTVNECHFARNVIVEEYDQSGVDVNTILMLEDAIIAVINDADTTTSINILLQNGWTYSSNVFDFSKTLNMKSMTVALTASQSFINAQSSNQSPFEEKIADIPTAYAPLKEYSTWVEFSGVSMNGAKRLCSILLRITPNGEVFLTKINNEQNYSKVNIHVNYL